MIGNFFVNPKMRIRNHNRRTVNTINILSFHHFSIIVFQTPHSTKKCHTVIHNLALEILLQFLRIQCFLAIIGKISIGNDYMSHILIKIIRVLFNKIMKTLIILIFDILNENHIRWRSTALRAVFFSTAI
ncbi:hypothetical protein BW12_04210 [Bifidobacterium sp. UTCIF-3]|nr:hypothetical protein BW09_09590 [Bifidobacterium sp. UTCIF-1]TPF79365.1 hypothetical protein BW08_10455 [Bifidobacterium sp. UTCIF-24]TPF82451.1 hypothetical protein BW12_04210 [Bifidobacterium sp. UTCIF-3]TPF84096.1 hypothetical protein BW07_06660 [Bifidobacterium sp. UTCIF-36]TPF88654.1 hypothetical protein BW10_08825 [Bifidobacterium sp. UTBIF-56]